MKKFGEPPENQKNIVRIGFLILLILSSSIFWLTSCNQSNSVMPTITRTLTPLITVTPKLPLNTPVPSATVDIPTTTPLYPPLSQIRIEVTQMPIIVSTINPLEKEYLYKEAKVTFSVPHWNGAGFLNLDDLNDNGQQNSDVIIYIDTGSMGTTFEIMPTNLSRYYFSDQTAMDFSSCYNGLPRTSAEWMSQFDEHPILQSMIETGKDYCVLTNEGRIAVVNMDIDSRTTDAQGNLGFSVIVTVYNRIVTELFTPAPTATNGPSPTPTNRYSKRNISDPEQITLLDTAIQSFIDAIKNRDKEFIANMVSYPIYVRFSDTYEVKEIENPKDFAINFDKIIPEIYVTEISKATIEKNVQSYPGTILLEFNAGSISFTDNGLIEDVY